MIIRSAVVEVFSVSFQFMYELQLKVSKSAEKYWKSFLLTLLRRTRASASRSEAFGPSGAEWFKYPSARGPAAFRIGLRARHQRYWSSVRWICFSRERIMPVNGSERGLVRGALTSLHWLSNLTCRKPAGIYASGKMRVGLPEGMLLLQRDG